MADSGNFSYNPFYDWSKDQLVDYLSALNINSFGSVVLRDRAFRAFKLASDGNPCDWSFSDEIQISQLFEESESDDESKSKTLESMKEILEIPSPTGIPFSSTVYCSQNSNRPGISVTSSTFSDCKVAYSQSLKSSPIITSISSSLIDFELPTYYQHLNIGTTPKPKNRFLFYFFKPEVRPSPSSLSHDTFSKRFDKQTNFAQFHDKLASTPKLTEDRHRPGPDFSQITDNRNFIPNRAQSRQTNFVNFQSEGQSPISEIQINNNHDDCSSLPVHNSRQTLTHTHCNSNKPIESIVRK